MRPSVRFLLEMIGLYGATCNNLYVFAKALHRHEIALKLILDRKDNFPHSQPVWEDLDLFFTAGFDFRSINWDTFEKEQNWAPPPYYVTPRSDPLGWKTILRESRLAWPLRFLAARWLRSQKDAVGVFEEMRTCSFLIVCGTEAAVLAMLSGVPYMIFPHGSDMRLAIGATPKKGWKGKIIEQLCVQAFRRALCIGSQLPDASAEVPLSDYRRHFKVERLPLPYEVIPRLPQAERRQRLIELFQRLDQPLPPAEHYAFVPSRINFHWKGHDRLLAAIKEAGSANKLHFIFLGWGDDYLSAMATVKEQGLSEQVTILPIFCSKGFLYRFFEAADFILDELNGSGSYGTALSEAMSRGCPIVSWVGDMFDQPGWEAPPVLHARSQAELKEFILKLSAGQIDLDAQATLSQEWFRRVHSEAAVVPLIRSRFAPYLVD